MIGKLQRVPLRDVWKHEALDFTKWLEENPDVLSEALGIQLSNIERERSAGSFNVDLVGEGDNGDTVIIENQLERSNHEHLGKVLTYLAAIEAKTAVWIVSDPRPEHVKAIAWLNDSSSADFYLLKVEAVKIGDSEPAPLLTRIVGPSEDSKSVEQEKKKMAERHVLRRRFWEQMIERLKDKNIAMHSNLSPGIAPWLSAGAGKSGLSFSYLVHMLDVGVYLYIDRGKGAEAETKKIYDGLLAHRREIEADFGGQLKWSDDSARRSMISYDMDIGGLKHEDKWPEIQEAMIDAMIRLEKALRPYIDSLKG